MTINMECGNLPSLVNTKSLSCTICYYYDIIVYVQRTDSLRNHVSSGKLLIFAHGMVHCLVTVPQHAFVVMIGSKTAQCTLLTYMTYHILTTRLLLTIKLAYIIAPSQRVLDVAAEYVI